jgi:PPE-repeat protein
MLPSLSSFAENVVHIVTGKYLKTLVDRIKRQTPIAGANVRMQETAEGIMLHADLDSIVTPTTTLLYDFKATLAGVNSLTIAGGRVIGTIWGTINQDSPFPPDLLSEQFTIATQTLSVPSGSSVWLKITASTTDIALTGQLSLVDSVTRTVTTGGGGAGGQGGGGGGSGDSSLSTAGQVGATGSTAVLNTPGAADAGVANGGIGPGEGVGTPAYGGPGGNGGAGGLGESKAFIHYNQFKASLRLYTATGATLEVAADKPVSSGTAFYVRIASHVDGIITQYQCGSYHITFPTITFIVP